MFLRRLIQRWRERRWRAQRLLFPYFDGQVMRHADPFQVWRQAASDPALGEAATALVDQGKEPETSEFIAAIAKLFDLKRWDGTRPSTSGLTDWEILKIFADFQEYIAAIKKKHNPGPTSPQPTA